MENKSVKVLIVDDFSTMRVIVKNGLISLGFGDFVEAEDGVKALEKLQEEDFGLIVSDSNMPNMMGVDLLRAVRADDGLKDIPFILIASENKQDDVVEAFAAGVSSYVMKPFTVSTLGAEIKKIFKR